MTCGFQKSWWLALITVAAMNLSTLLYSLAARLLGFTASTLAAAFVGELVIAAAIIIGACLLGISSPEKLFKKSDCRRYPIKLLPLLVLLAIITQYFVIYSLLPVHSILSILFGVERSSDLVPEGAVQLAWSFLLLCVTAPILEEFLCRGIIMKLLEKYGFMISLITSSLIFSLMHFDIRNLLQIFFMGIMLGTVKQMTGSIWASVTVHAVNNFVSLLQMTLLEDTSGFWVIFCSILAVAAFPPVLYIFLRQTEALGIRKNIVIGSDVSCGFSAAALICIMLVIGYNMAILFSRMANGDILTELFMLMGN